MARGRLSASRRIDLDEPIEGIEGEVEVTVRALGVAATAGVDVFQLLDLLSPAHRTRTDIDRQLADERSGWPER